MFIENHGLLLLCFETIFILNVVHEARDMCVCEQVLSINKDWMFYTHQWCSKLTLTHTVVATDVKRQKRKNKAWSLRHSGCAYIYVCINICPRVEGNLINGVYTTAFTQSFVRFGHTRWRNVDWGFWRTWCRGRCWVWGWSDRTNRTMQRRA